VQRGKDLTPQEVSDFQPHQEKKKRSVWARFQGLKAAGRVVPETRGLRLEELYNENDEQFNRQQDEGVHKRIELGKFSESTPVVVK